MSNTTITPAVAGMTLAGAAAGNFPSSAFFFVTEFGSLLNEPGSGSQFPHCPSLADQVVPFGGISAVSAPFSSATRIVRVQANAICAVKIGGSAPVAVPAGIGGTSRMTAGQTEYFAVKPGDAAAVIVTT